MTRPLRLLSLAWPGAVLASVLGARPAAALDPSTEAAAKVALRQALADYKNQDMEQSELRLRKAIDECGADNCRKLTRAVMLRELGTAQWLNGKEAPADDSFRAARNLEPTLSFSHYDIPELSAVWDKAAPDGTAAPTPAEPGAEPTVLAEDPDEAEPAAPSSRRPPKEAAPVRYDEPAAPPAYARFWFGVSGSLDYSLVPSGRNFCLLTPDGHAANTAGVFCTAPDGADLDPQKPAPLSPGLAGNLGGGFVSGTSRLLVSADYVATPNVLAGVRVGIVFGGYPGDRAYAGHPDFSRRIHVELRGSYLFGQAPLTHGGFAPLVVAGVGVSEFAGETRSFVFRAPVAGKEPVSLWVRSGPWFANAGGGVRYQFSPRTAAHGVLRANLSLGGEIALFSVGPEIGFQYGF